MWKMLLFFLCACQNNSNDKDTGQESQDSSEPTDTGPSQQLLEMETSSLPSANDPCRAPLLMKVNYVVDGDTVFAQPQTGSEEKIRLIGINSPEIGYQSDPDECYAREARTQLNELLGGKWMWLSFDEECEDIFGRTLGYLSIGNGEQDFIQRRMLQQGFAVAFPFDDTPTFSQIFEEDESRARENNIGGWGSCNW